MDVLHQVTVLLPIITAPGDYIGEGGNRYETLSLAVLLKVDFLGFQ
jgi:hypothetical protein